MDINAVDRAKMTDTSGNPLRAYFEKNPGRLISKWAHYFDIYHRHFERFRGSRCTLLEIGVADGGSLQMWREYLGASCRIVGVDIDPRCAAFAEPGIEIVVGDQADRAFLRELRNRVPKIDILIDDGGHTSVQQRVTFEELYDTVSPTGVYVCEDLHTSYWSDYGGGYRHPDSFIELGKRLVDQLNAFWSRDAEHLAPTAFTHSVAGLHFYDSMLVIEKRPRVAAKPAESGTRVFFD